MKRLIDSLMGAVRRFGVFDFAVFKLALLGAGILLGAYFSSFFLTWSTIVWAVVAVLFITLFFRLAGCMKKK